MNHQIYLDHAATTYVIPEVITAMRPYFDERYGNPSAVYSLGVQAEQALENARQTVAQILNCHADEIVFTASGTESDNLALQGVAKTMQPGEIVISAIEHHAVLKTAQYLQQQGWKLTILPVDKDGLVSVEELSSAVSADTKIVSIMYANNEIGTIQPIKELVSVAKQKSPELVFHTDACQAAPYLDLNVDSLGVDLLTLNGSKVYAPKGVGLLYVRKGISLEPIIYGGGQEKGVRAGTENIPLIVGLGKALELAHSRKKDEAQRLTKLRDQLIEGLTTEIERVTLNGHAKYRLPNNVNLTFEDIEGEAMLLHLDGYGIMANTGSACAADDLDVSHVLKAIDLPYEKIHGSIRFTLGLHTTLKDIQYVITVMPQIVDKLRAISPVNLTQQDQHPQLKS